MRLAQKDASEVNCTRSLQIDLLLLPISPLSLVGVLISYINVACGKFILLDAGSSPAWRIRCFFWFPHFPYAGKAEGFSV